MVLVVSLHSLSFILSPQFAHVFESLSLGFGNEFPNEDSGNYADDSVETVGEPVTEVIALCKMHVEHRNEG